ncbi:MAG: hypothetical protein ACRC7R_04985 [Sarcina sp.]
MNYKYKNMPITPAVAEYILRNKLINSIDLPLTRQQVIDLVLKYHIQNGGKNKATDLTGAVKKSLRVLKKEKLIKNPLQDQWVLKGANLKDTNFNKLDKIGNKEFIYIYYYPAYKELAELKGVDIWPCKISIFQNYAVIKNIMPEDIKVESIAVDNAINIEKVLKKLLGDTAWINTSPNKILEIVNTITAYKAIN